MPSLYAELTRELASDDPALDHVAQIVARDPGMAAKVIQIVNSSFFGMRTRITDPAQAVTMLGIDTVVGLILTGPFRNPEVPAGEDSRWIAGLATGTLARRIARSEGLDKQAIDDAYLSGLLCDSGRTVLAARLPSDFSQIESDAETGSVLESEHRLLGATHAEIGAFILGVWGLPSTVVEAVAFHHDPVAAAHTEFGALTAVHAASVIVSQWHGDHTTHLDEEYLRAVGKFDHFAEWQAAFEPPEEIAS
jgi:HD-like signal output (HDOD) protein